MEYTMFGKEDPRALEFKVDFRFWRCPVVPSFRSNVEMYAQKIGHNLLFLVIWSQGCIVAGISKNIYIGVIYIGYILKKLLLSLLSGPTSKYMLKFVMFIFQSYLKPWVHCGCYSKCPWYVDHIFAMVFEIARNRCTPTKIPSIQIFCPPKGYQLSEVSNRHRMPSHFCYFSIGISSCVFFY